MMNRRRLLAASAAALAPVRAFAAEWPVRPITLVVPYTPPGSWASGSRPRSGSG